MTQNIAEPASDVGARGDVRQEAVTFYSDGTRLAGDLFLPAAAAGSRLPAVVVCHGFGGIKEFFIGDIARAFAARGFAALAFDYRGFGESDGRRNRLFPLEQVVDVQAAVAWMQLRSEVDPERIAVYGTSFGGGVALEAAALDDRIRAVISAVGIGDCERWLRGLRPYWQWFDFLGRLRADEERRLTTGESEIVEPEEIMVRDPESLAHEQQLRERYPNRAFKLDLASGDAIRRFKPVESIHRISPRAVMLIGCEDDTLTPWDEVLDMYEHAREPKRMLPLRGLTYHEVYKPQHIAGVLDAVVEFLGTHMGPASP